MQEASPPDSMRIPSAQLSLAVKADLTLNNNRVIKIP